MGSVLNLDLQHSAERRLSLLVDFASAFLHQKKRDVFKGMRIAKMRRIHDLHSRAMHGLNPAYWSVLPTAEVENIASARLVVSRKNRIFVQL